MGKGRRLLMALVFVAIAGVTQRPAKAQEVFCDYVLTEDWLADSYMLDDMPLEFPVSSYEIQCEEVPVTTTLQQPSEAAPQPATPQLTTPQLTTPQLTTPQPTTRPAAPHPTARQSTTPQAQPQLGLPQVSIVDLMVEPTIPGLTVSDFSFAVDGDIRNTVLLTYAEKLAQSDPATAAALIEADVFGLLSQELASRGLSDSNLVDSLVVSYITLWEIVNQTEVGKTPQMIAALRQQVLNTLGPVYLDGIVANRQLLSDTVLLDTFVNYYNTSNAIENDPAAGDRIAAGIAEIAKRLLGTDFRTVRLTDNGFVR